MAKLSAAARKELPKKDFAQPGKRGFPIEDKAHARAAKSRASEMEHKGKISRAVEKKIDAKADKKLGEGKKSGEHVSVKNQHDRLEVRKIANGHIVRHTTSHPKDGYMESEYYSATAPKVRVK